MIIISWYHAQKSKLYIIIHVSYILQVNEKIFELKRDIIIGIVEKVQETSSDTGLHNRAITVLHEQ